MSKIRIGLVGIGYLGSIHLELLLKNDAFELVGVYEHNQDRIKELRMKYPKLELFASFEALLSCVEAVGISATTSAHFELLRAAMDVNCAVFVEKPLCQEIEQAKELENLHAEKETFLQVGHVERYNPVFQAFVHELKNSKITHFESKRCATFQQRGSDVSVILDLMIHDIDLLLSLVDDMPQGMEVQARQKQTTFADQVKVNLFFDQELSCTLYASRIDNHKERSIKVVTENSIYLLDLLHFSLTKQSLLSEGKMQILVEKSNALAAQWQDFAANFRMRKAPLVDLRAGVRALEVALEIEQLANRDLHV
jgi:virulence factor